MRLLEVSKVRDVAGRALAQAGVPADHAVLQLDLLLEAELRGVPSHGLLRLDRVIERIANGVANPHAKGRQTWRSDAFLAVDGQMGLGPVVANAAIAVIQERARRTGIALAAITNSNHLGMLGWYAENVAAQGQALIALSTSEALVHPWGGRKALIGTNPIAIGVPTEGEPFVMDTATSIVSMGEIHDHAHRGAGIPEHWALDADGNPTTDPNRAKTGALASFGGAKGYALGLAFELLVTSLAGAAIGPDVRGTLDATDICNKGDVFIVIDGPQPRLADYLDLIRGTEPAQGFDRVLVPGDRARECRKQRLVEGIPVAEEVWERLQVLANSPISPNRKYG
ncbi:Ldh family oxidoreductase [Bosea sp. BIWAKO-01]|uniref:Ldh family oxidoreductase n=1 Tax=Bosea sp. BIWAKO-01 TaxID=506668 RepID=UPI0008533733|nr:Ldh family oxidoreductase [Bosea sp. BIWAKO-01]GAU86260.1 R-2-hydroxyacid dehydrogenase [Bosea sp. BIWAKO-01]